ncbi:MAG: sugar kinase [Candidatus Poribacteria bacterium]|nr:sugar kinase [Candidatus Poribacteria bacterium]MDE0502579.1 sugar kinase [Candidatus Poribacteria bacterium]
MDVLSLGIFVVDVIGRPIDTFPEKGRLMVFDEFEMHSGGCANNTAITLSKLGINVGAMGRIGTDTFGDMVLQVLDNNRVDTRAMIRDADINSPVTFVAVASDGERSFLHYMGTNSVLSEDDMNLDLIRSSKILHVAGTFVMPKLDGEPTARILRHAKDAGVTTSLDTVWDTSGNWLKTLEPCLPYIDVFLPSIEEAEQLTGLDSPPEIARFLMDYGIRTVGLKMGERGSYVRTGTDEIYVPAYEVDVVDATGAGDAYVAGFLAGIVMGWDLKRTSELASAAGAACVTAIGTTAGIKNLEETLEIIRP